MRFASSLRAISPVLAALSVATSAHGQVQTAGVVFVHLDATAAQLGNITAVTNHGSLRGFFEARGGGVTIPRVAIAGASGTRGIQFDGGDYMQHVAAIGGALFPAPAGLVGVDPTRSIEVWAFNPVIDSEETLLSWGRRGGPDGSNMSFNYGSHGQFGAVGHWGAAGPDLGWNDAGGAPQAGRWHHLAYTYNGTTSRVYADGVLQNSETLGPGTINTHANLPISLATQLEADGVTPTPTLRGSLTLAKVRIHDGVLTDAQILNNYNAERPAFEDPPSVPLAAAPAHRYSFNEPAATNATDLAFSDAIGTADGIVRGAGASFNGTRLVLNGGASTTAAYGDLPNGLLSAISSDNGGSGEVTVEGWIKVTGIRFSQRIFDFGSTIGGELNSPGGGGAAVDSFALYGQLSAGTGTRRLEVRNADSLPASTNTVDFPTPTFNTNAYFAVTWKESTGEVLIYENGAPVAALVTPARLSAINDVNNWLGRANAVSDQNAQIEFDELRIYHHVLSPGEVRGAFGIGPGVVNVAGPVSIYAHPQPYVAPEAGSATFSVGASGTPPFVYQWLRNGTPISGATNPVYVVSPALLADDGAQFSVAITNISGAIAYSVVSSNAQLTVLPDTNAPTLVSAVGVALSSWLVTDGLQVEFSETITSASATNLANYSLSGPSGNVPLTGAQLDSSLQRVSLQTSAPLVEGATYTLRVSNVRDRSAAGNTIAANTEVTFIPGFSLRTIGALPAGNSVTRSGTGYDVTAAGRDIGNTADEFAFHSQLRTGDFDVQVRVESLQLADGYSEAGLMARDSTTTNALYAAVLASPGLGGVKFESRSAPGANAVATGSLPVNYPYTWLRLQRTGNLFTGFGSLDGATWVRLGSALINNMPSQVYLGFAVSSHNPASSVQARFRDAAFASGGAIVNSLALPFEPLGPSSRRTCLVISEIMYHPPEVPGLSLEYIEIFNGQDYYEDLSDFRIDGDVHYDFPAGTILQSGQFLVIARDPTSVQNYYNISGVLGPWRLQTNVTATTTNVTAENLPNSSGTVRLESELGAHLLEVDYDSEGLWPAAADGAGHSLVLARPSYGEGDVRAWAASQVIGGSPGRHETYLAEPQQLVVINEFLAHTDDPDVDYVELFNTGAQPVDIGGCWLSDDFDTNKFRIPNNTVLPARGYLVLDQTQLGFNLSSDGEEILLVNSNRTRVLDAVRFGGQENGVSRGRYPNGAPEFVDLSSLSPGDQNPGPRRRDIVINEIMYHPISGNDDDEYIELHNRGTSPVNVGDWRLTDGINFTIPLNTIINPGQYLVIAKNRTNLLARYPNLAANPAAVLGDYGGQLNNGGERLALAMPDYSFQTNGPIVTTNSFYIDVNEVTYRDGGRWGQWSDGGGSSLELIDARADNRLAANWADSDESGKAAWTLIERTGLIDLGMTTGNGTPNRFEFFIEGAGECLVDDVEVLSNGGTNRVLNPGFESGATSWAFQGTHAQTTVQTGGAFGGTQCLLLRAVERGDPGPNRVRTAIATMPTGGANQATLRARVRWRRGNPNFLMRIRGQWIECAGQMALPTNLGTPGAANNRRLPNVGPAIFEVGHHPALPAANEPVVVTARVNDPDGLSNVTFRHRVDPDNTFSDVPMNDAGAAGDRVAGDGIYSATVPGYPAATLIAFHISARDGAGTPATSVFPKNDRECLVRYGETIRAGHIATYRLWLTQSNLAYWGARERNSNEGLDATFVYGDGRRVIYNAQTLYSGSPWHTANAPYTGPLGNTCDYEVNFPEDDLFLGQQDFVLNGQNPVYSATFNQDVSAQAETTAYWFGRKLGLPFNHKRHIFVSLNGQARGMIYFDHQQPNTDVLEEYFPNDSDGHLHKIEDWFEFDDAGNGFDIITCTLQNFVVGGQKRPERYRWTWRPRASTAPNDFADLFALVDAANAPGPEPYTTATLNLMDMRASMRVWALQHMIGNWDSYGYERGKNMYAYKPEEGRWRMVLWDLDLVLGKDSRGPNDGLFNNGSETVVTRMYTHPPFVREYWCAIHELANTWMVPSIYSPLVDARYAAFRANGVPVDSPDQGNSAGASGGMRGWIAARRTYLLSQIPNAVFNVTTTNFLQTSNNYVAIAGWAPVTVKEILVNGGLYPITWVTVSNWTVRVPVGPGTNQLTVTAVDAAGNIVSNRLMTVNYTGSAPDPADSVLLSEIMFNPLIDGTSFVELLNRQSGFTFDLSGWRINGLGYTFPTGAVLLPRSHLVLTRNRAEFAKLYGATKPAFDDFSGALDNDGETLTLFRPGSQAGEEITVDKVKYEARPPWPAGAAGVGGSLQVIDPTQDNARVSNWSDGKGWRFITFTGIPNATRLIIYLNSAAHVYLDEITLVAGTVPGVGPNLIANGGFEEPLIPNWKILGAFATNSTPSPAARLNGDFGLDLRFTGPGGGNQYFYQDVPNFASNTTHTLSFWYLPSTNANNLEVRMSTGFRATVNVRALSEQNLATPGTNSVLSASIPPYPLLWLNEVLPLNTNGLADSNGEREPWIEVYNSGSVPIPLDGFRLSDDYLELSKWAFPAGAVLDPGQFKIIFADGETNETTASEWHTGFRLTAGTGSVALSRLLGSAPQIVDYLNFDDLRANRSYGSCPDGQLFDRQELFYTTPGTTNNCSAAPLFVYINEWMAANTGFLRDPADNDADDWFELYNPNAFTIDLGGYFLTDNLLNQFQYPIPNNGHYTIPAFGFLLVWADGEPQQNSTNRADLHVNFQLRQAGEAIGLFAADGTLIDSVVFGQQTDNVSQGHYPQGTGPIYFMASPSPRAGNADPNPSSPPQITRITFPGGTLVELTISTVAGRTYRIEYSDNLGMPLWNSLGGNHFAGGNSLTVSDTSGLTTQRFYRAVLVQ